MTTAASGAGAALLVGCSGGIGTAIAQALVGEGYRTFGTSRSGRSTAAGVVEPLALDVTDDAAVTETVGQVVSAAGGLDVVAYNAGTTLIGAVEETSPAEAQHMLEANLLGVHRVVRAALPQLRARRGRVVVTGSIAGFLVKPYEVWYAVAKHGLDAYAEVLRSEVASFGVRVTLLEPGFIRTDLGQHATVVAEPLAVYDAGRQAAEDRMSTDLAGGAPPARVGAAVTAVLRQDRPPLRVLVGRDARALNLVKRLMPDRLFELGMSRRFRTR